MAERFDPIGYESYYSITQTVLFLFIAAQAPELVGPDQRDRVLPLYFSRPILRSDYAFAKLIALVAALLLFTLAPQALLFFGRILQAPELGDGIAKNLPSLLPILLSALFISIMFAAVGLAIAALTPRRAYATVTIIGLFIASNAIARDPVRGPPERSRAPALDRASPSTPSRRRPRSLQTRIPR
jgi:ABC-2 type transport system permease protein